MRIVSWVLGLMSTIATVQLITAVAAFGFHQDPPLAPEPPFVVCHDQTYALCAEASCFVYNGVAYCKCDVLKGDSISLQLDFSSPIGERNVCSVNEQGKTNGYMVSTFSFPSNIEKGGRAAVYTCPGPTNARSGVAAPVAYGQCDGGICFTSTTGQRFPGFDRRLQQGEIICWGNVCYESTTWQIVPGPDGSLQQDEIICSCPISTGAPGSTNPAGLGYQVFGAYHPEAPKESRCDANACAACSVPVANGSTIPVGAPTGSAAFLTVRLDGPPLPKINECLCTCTLENGNTTCTVVEDTTP
jgi:hypothetical protein